MQAKVGLVTNNDPFADKEARLKSVIGPELDETKPINHEA